MDKHWLEPLQKTRQEIYGNCVTIFFIENQKTGLHAYPVHALILVSEFHYPTNLMHDCKMDSSLKTSDKYKSITMIYKSVIHLLTIFSRGAAPKTLKLPSCFPGVQVITTACCPTRVAYSSMVAFNFLQNNGMLLNWTCSISNKFELIFQVEFLSSYIIFG